MLDLMEMIEHIGPSNTQGYYVFYILKQKKAIQDG